MSPGTALGQAAGHVTIIYRWDAATRKWQHYVPGGAGYLDTLTMLHRGEAYWVIANRQAEVVIP
jgi:hypothetical protein